MPKLVLSKNSAAAPALAWFWSGWARALPAATGAADEIIVDLGGSLEGLPKGSWVGLPTADAARLDAAIELGAAKVLTGFLPDEVNIAWTPLQRETLLKKAVWLPPCVVLPTRAPNKAPRPLLLTDNSDEELFMVEPQMIHADVSAPTYPPFALPKGPLDRIFVRRSVTTADDVAGSLGALGWMLACQSAQVEQALWDIAAEHGVKVVCWTHAQSSPLRSSSGYYEMIMGQAERTIRQRVLRVAKMVAPPKINNPAKTSADLESVMNTNAWLSLGYDHVLWDVYVDAKNPWTTAFLSTAAAKHLCNVYFRAALNETLNRQTGNTPAKLAALLPILFYDVLFFTPRGPAPAIWSRMMHRWPGIVGDVTVRAMRDFGGTTAQFNRLVQDITAGISLREFPAATARAFAELILRLDTTRQEDGHVVLPWRARLMAELWSGQPIEKCLAGGYDKHKGAEGFYSAAALVRMRQGASVAEVAALVDKDLAAGKTGPNTWNGVLPFLVSSVELPAEKYWKAAVENMGVESAVYCAFDGLWGYMTSENWRKSHDAFLRDVANDVISHESESEFMQQQALGHLVLSGRSAEALQRYAQNKSKLSAYAPVLLINVLCVVHEPLDFLWADVNVSGIQPLCLPSVAELALKTGRSEIATEALRRLCREDPNFFKEWIYSASWSGQMRLLAVFAKIYGLTSLYERVMANLQYLALPDLAVYLDNTPSSVAQAPSDIAEWLESAVK